MEDAGAPMTTVARRPAGATMDAAAQAIYDEAVRGLRSGRLLEAETALRSLVEQWPHLASLHANLGLVYRQMGRLDAAAGQLDEAVRISPRNAGYHNQLGLTWRMMGCLDHAQRALEMAIEIDPTHVGALINLAVLHDMQGEPALAETLYQRSAALLPGEAGMINRWIAELKSRSAGPKPGMLPAAHTNSN
jgi:Flp pilus assembly protein TadD